MFTVIKKIWNNIIGFIGSLELSCDEHYVDEYDEKELEEYFAAKEKHNEPCKHCMKCPFYEADIK